MKALIGFISSALIAMSSTTISASATQKADEVIDYAETLIGISGRPNIITDYWNLVTEWCAQTIVYVGDKTGTSSSFPRVTFVDRSGPYIGFRDWFESRGRFFYSDTYTPLKGDLIVFDYDKDNKGDHIGFVSEVNTQANAVKTIEGNANDKVAANAYSMSNDNILGYCKPSYNDATEQKPVTTTEATVSTTASTVSTTTQTETVNQEAKYYVSSSIGCNLRSKPDYSNNIIQILDTDTSITVYDIKNGFAYCKVDKTGAKGYVHTSTIAEAGQGFYNYGCTANYYISSDIGCKMRSEPYFDNKNVICILDTNTKITVLSKDYEFSYCEVTLGNSVVNGYIHNSVMNPI